MHSRPANVAQTRRFKDPLRLIKAAKGSGWVSGKHIDQDKETDINKYVERVVNKARPKDNA
jgi:hypothetical protein